MENNNHPLPDLIRSKLEFITRAQEQLIAKRNNLVILRDIEKLFHDEQNFFILLKRNIDAIPPEYKHLFIHLAPEIETIETDLFKVGRWRRLFSLIRAHNLPKIIEAEKDFVPRPNFRITKISSYHDEIVVYANKRVPEFRYRLEQSFVYIDQLILAFYSKQDPPRFNRLAVPQGCFYVDTAIFTDDKIEPRLPSRDYIFCPERPLWLEYECYIHMYVEESIILGPQHFQSDEYITYVPPARHYPCEETVD